ncbi:MAG: nitrogen fixation protein NifH [Candidatus Aminicenantes bacterium RBG_16_63_16]|nr:MAG: nitrogen fixation protein NifH [Candidatus Aminicenantes bacterium RBG_16_63_16]
MNGWKSLLKADPVPWLLEEDNPSVRYFTLVDIVGLSPRDRRVAAARRAIMEKGIVPKILALQKESGYWESPEDFYIRTKYKGTVWQLIILAELGAGGSDPRIRKACEFVLEYSQDRTSGGFAYRGSRGGGGQHSAVIPCLTGNMVWSLIRLGRLRDARVRRGLDWITTYARFDDGESRAPKAWPYDKREPCWGKHTCHSAAAKFLKALAEIPEGERSADIRRTIDEATEYFLKHHIYKRSHNLNKAVKPKWEKFGFPTVWDGDALEVFEILARLGCRDSRMQDAADLIISKQDEQGRWLLENTYNGKFRANIERKDRPSKWVTLLALRALRHWPPHIHDKISIEG